MLTRARGAVLLLLALLLTGTALLAAAPQEGRTYTVLADFEDTTGLYIDNQVRYLGVGVGRISQIEPMGTVMRVEMEVDPKIKIPSKAGAQIMQSALLTDRYIELGPAYKGGPAIEPGAVIPSSRTRSPVSFDDLSASINSLVRALDDEEGDGIGALIAVAAQQLKGNGGRIREMLLESRDALAGLNRKAPDLVAVTQNLRRLAKTLSDNEAMIRRFVKNLSATSGVVARQTKDLDIVLRQFSSLMTEVSGFLKRNREKLTKNLGDVAKVNATIRGQQETIARVFDYFPTGAENIARSYDWKRRSIRVQFALRETLVFNKGVRQMICQNLLSKQACSGLTNSTGSGILDLVFDVLAQWLPRKW